MIPIVLIITAVSAKLGASGMASNFALALFNFNVLNNSLRLIIVAYLLMTLVVVVELCSSFKGSLELSSF